jgi:hypothetical protein
MDLTPLIFILMVAPDATDYSLQILSQPVDDYVSETECRQSLLLAQEQNPQLYYWCESNDTL